jgi:hypothetical protein
MSAVLMASSSSIAVMALSHTAAGDTDVWVEMLKSELFNYLGTTHTLKLFSAGYQRTSPLVLGLAALDCLASPVVPWLARSYRRHESTLQRLCC